MKEKLGGVWAATRSQATPLFIMGDFIRADAWIGFCELVDELGGNSADVLAASNLTPEDLQPIDRYLPLNRFIAMLNHAVKSTGRLDFGMQLGLRRQLAQIGVVGLALDNATTWRSAVRIGARVGHIANPLVSYDLTPGGAPGTEMIVIVDRAEHIPDREQAIERTAAFLLAAVKSLVRTDFVPLAVHFTHGQIASIDAYVAALGVTPSFNQQQSGLVVPTEDLDRPLASANPELGSIALAYLESQNLIEAGDLIRAARLTARSLVELGEASAANLARALAVEVRTLQRRLKTENATIDGVFDQARRDLVQRLLTDNLHSVTEITSMLGYSSPATLTRSCNRWFGDTPANLLGRTDWDAA